MSLNANPQPEASDPPTPVAGPRSRENSGIPWSYVLLLVLATISWHAGLANWKLRRDWANIPLWISPCLALAAGWRARSGRASIATSLATGAVLAAIAWVWWSRILSPLLRPVAMAASLALAGFWIERLAWSVGGSRRLVSLLMVSALTAVTLWAAQFRGLDGDGRGMMTWAGWSASVAEDASEARNPSPSAVIGECPEFRGPRRDGVSDSPLLAWDGDPSRTPRLLWRLDVGAGWGGYSVSRSLAVTQQQLDGREWLTCQRVEDGVLVWRTELGEGFESAGGPGPRATPTIHFERVFAVSASGALVACRLEDGDLLWRVSLDETLATNRRPHGFSGSPLVVGDAVIVGGGSRYAASAWRSATGESLWRGPDGPDSYASPMVVRLPHEQQLVVFPVAGAFGLSPVSGEVLWSFDWRNDGQTNVAQPIAIEPNALVLASGYGRGAVCLEFGANGKPDVRWTSKRLQAKFGSPVRVEDMIVGLDNGVLVALDAIDGRRLWKQGRFGHGQLWTDGKGRLLVQSEGGPVHWLRVSRDGAEDLGRITPWRHRTWNTPCLAGNVLVVRSDRQAACYIAP